MSKWKDLAKNGWHPEKEGTTFKGQMRSLIGRGDSSDTRSSHVAAPLSSLRDPTSFAPPPKRDPNQPLPPPSQSPVQSNAARPPPVPPARPPNGSSASVSHQQEGVIGPVPTTPKGWQLDTTGLSTSHLPPPPGRLDGADGRSPTASSPTPYSPATSRASATKGPPPSLPPRLPPRSGTSSPVRPESPVLPSRPANQAHSDAQRRAENGFLNQGAASRLGSAGISVPGLGIGHTQATPAPPVRSPITPGAAEQGTTWQQKQAAIKTASQFRNDPASVSLADARSAASTANNFRQRHGEQITSGLKTANALGQRFGVSGGTTSGNDVASGSGSTTHPKQQQGAVSVAALSSVIRKKQPPPPPPPKKLGLGLPSARHDGDRAAPPPVPMNTRPSS